MASGATTTDAEELDGGGVKIIVCPVVPGVVMVVVSAVCVTTYRLVATYVTDARPDAVSAELIFGCVTCTAIPSASADDTADTVVTSVDPPCGEECTAVFTRSGVVLTIEANAAWYWVMTPAVKSMGSLADVDSK